MRSIAPARRIFPRVLELLTTPPGCWNDVGILPDVKARLLLHERHQVSEDSFAELRSWQVTSPVPGPEHICKYSLALAYITAGKCVLRYDNEAG